MQSPTPVIRHHGTDILRLRADNPSVMTATGTNTYLLIRDTTAVIVDPGPDLALHLHAILAAIAGKSVVGILVTHAHLDHSALAPRLAQATGAPIFAYGDAYAGRSASMTKLAAAGLTGGAEGIDSRFAPNHRLQDRQTVPFAGLEIRTLHTPGHLGGHLAFALDNILFSGDHVMGWSSTFVSPPDGSMTDYMASLAKLAAENWQIIFPGHGDPITAPAQRLAELAQHRRAREAAILAALATGPQTPSQLAKTIYTDSPPHVLSAATRNVLAHLIDLLDRNIVASANFPTLDPVFHLITR